MNEMKLSKLIDKTKVAIRPIGYSNSTVYQYGLCHTQRSLKVAEIVPWGALTSSQLVGDQSHRFALPVRLLA